MIQGGLPLVIVQPGVVYGPGDPSVIGNLLRQYLQRRLPIRPHGAAFCWGHVDDTARGHILAMERGRAGESYILAGPPHTLEEALEVAEEITGIRPPRLRPPALMLRAMAGLASAVERVMPLPQTYSGETLRIAAGARTRAAEPATVARLDDSETATDRPWLACRSTGSRRDASATAPSPRCSRRHLPSVRHGAPSSRRRSSSSANARRCRLRRGARGDPQCLAGVGLRSGMTRSTALARPAIARSIRAGGRRRGGRIPVISSATSNASSRVCGGPARM